MLSIYHKTCPSCMAIVPADVGACDCGYSFLAASDAELPHDAQELAEAELFEAYLAARIDQALVVVESAQAELAKDPKSFDRAARVLKAVHEVRLAQDDLAAQRERTAEIRLAVSGESPASPAGPAQSTRAPQAFTAKQAAQAERIMAKFEGTETRDCPQCGTTLPVTTVLCFCGHAFAPAGSSGGARLRTGPRSAIRTYC